MHRFFYFFLLLLASCGLGSISGPGEHDFDCQLSGGYMLIRTSSDCIEIRPEASGVDTPVIKKLVTEVAWDNRFILAKRKHAENAFDFWILETDGRKLHGPLDWETFVAKRNELRVPDTLSLKDVYSYRK